MRQNAVNAFMASAEGNTVALSVANNSQHTAVTVPFPKSPEYSGSVLITNAIASVCFVKQGAGTQTADATCVPVPASGQRVIQLKPDTTDVAVFSTGTGTVYVTPGSGGV